MKRPKSVAVDSMPPGDTRVAVAGEHKLGVGHLQRRGDALGEQVDVSSRSVATSAAAPAACIESPPYAKRLPGGALSSGCWLI